MTLKCRMRAKLLTPFLYQVLLVMTLSALCVALWNKLMDHNRPTLFNNLNNGNSLNVQDLNYKNIPSSELLIKIPTPAFWPSELKRKIVFGSRKSIRERERIRHFPKIVEFKALEMCPPVSPIMVGWVDVEESVAAIRKENRLETEIRMEKFGVQLGGRYKPNDCQSRHKVGIVVPYRNRKDQLDIFVSFMHPFLQRQQLEYTIFVVEQSEGSPFNRGILMNIGFKAAQFQESFHCFIFHDIDLLPENDGNLYTCPEERHPRHMAFSIDIFQYKVTPVGHFGGVCALSANDFQYINGFSNVFWGWGGEDDNLYQRILFHNLTATRTFDMEPHFVPMMRYRTLYHKKAKPNQELMALIDEGKTRFISDGLTDLTYKRLNIQFKPLYTHISVDVQQ